MNREEDPQLWDLLGHGKVAEPSPFFARNVLRQLRNDAAPIRTSWFERWRVHRLLAPSLAAIAALVLTTVAVHTWTAGRDRPVASVVQPSPAETSSVEPVQSEPVRAEPVSFTDAEKADLNLLVADADDDDDDSFVL